jgi:agmatinase
VSDRPPPVPQVDAVVYPRFAGLRTFARLPRREDVERVDVAVLGAPFDSATTFRPGARFGPAAIREASLLLRPYSEPFGYAPFAELQVADAGDAPASPVDVAAAHTAIGAAARALHAAGARVLGLGGDHSVSLPLLREAAAVHGRLSVLQLDSHMDTWDTLFGAKVTHGTVFRRAAEEGLIDAATSLQVGLRGSLYAPTDMAANAELGFHTLLARELDDVGVAGALDIAARTLRPPLYITIDIDVLDPAFAPGTGTPETGGLTSRELLAFLRGLPACGLLPVSADLVEVAPPFDPAGVTAVAAAGVAFDLVSLLALGRTAS